MKKNLLFILILGALILAACGGGGGSEEPAALESVPADFAGKANPLGANAATDGAKVFQANCETCHGTQGHGDGVMAEQVHHCGEARSGAQHFRGIGVPQAVRGDRLGTAGLLRCFFQGFAQGLAGGLICTVR